MGSASRSCPVTATWFQLASALAPQCSVMSVMMGLSDSKRLCRLNHLPGVKTTCISTGMKSRGRYVVSLVPLTKFGVEPARWSFIFRLATHLKDIVNL